MPDLTSDGRPSSTSRRLRHDGSPGAFDRASGLGRAVSGRSFVIGAVIVLLIASALLRLAFEGWRSEVLDRIARGKSRVAEAVRPLAGLEPPGVEGGAWETAVDDTEAMLDDLVGTGRLDRKAINDLLERFEGDRVEPESAPALLAGVWDDAARLAPPPEGMSRPMLLLEPDANGEIDR